MKYILILFVGNLFALTCLCISAYLISNDKDGWGCFLFVGILTVSSYSRYIEDEKKQSLSDRVREKINEENKSSQIYIKQTAMMELFGIIESQIGKSFPNEIKTNFIQKEREQHKQTWDKGVEWGEANCEFEGETRLPKFDEYYSKTFKP